MNEFTVNFRHRSTGAFTLMYRESFFEILNDISYYRLFPCVFACWIARKLRKVENDINFEILKD